jgi:phage-related protein
MYRVLFYATASGRQPVLDWLRDLEAGDRKVIGEDLKVVQYGFPLGLPLCDHLGGGLWEVRSSLPSRVEARLIFFQHPSEKALIVVHGFIKKSQKTKQSELETARRRKAEFS